MKLNFLNIPSNYPQTTAQKLKIGQAVRYAAGNGVIRIGMDLYLEFNSNGTVEQCRHETVKKLGHGSGDLLPKKTEIRIVLEN
jgi:hypothetical protein